VLSGKSDFPSIHLNEEKVEQKAIAGENQQSIFGAVAVELSCW